MHASRPSCSYLERASVHLLERIRVAYCVCVVRSHLRAIVDIAGGRASTKHCSVAMVVCARLNMRVYGAVMGDGECVFAGMSAPVYMHIRQPIHILLRSTCSGTLASCIFFGNRRRSRLQLNSCMCVCVHEHDDSSACIFRRVTSSMQISNANYFFFFRFSLFVFIWCLGVGKLNFQVVYSTFRCVWVAVILVPTIPRNSWPFRGFIQTWMRKFFSSIFIYFIVFINFKLSKI